MLKFGLGFFSVQRVKMLWFFKSNLATGVQDRYLNTRNID